MEGLRRFLSSKMGKLMLLLCLSPLGLVGIENLFHSKSNPNEAAKVGDKSIDIATFQHTLNDQRQTLIKQVGDPSLINDAVLKDQVLQNLIDRTLLENQIAKLGLSIPDESLTALLKKDPQFADADGKFSNELFAQYLKANNINKEQLFNLKRGEIVLSQFVSNVINTAIYPMAAINAILDNQAQQRPVWVARIDWQPYAAQVSVTDAEIQAYYQQHQADIKSPALLDLSYLQVDKAQLNVAPPTEEEINQQYQALIKSQDKQPQYNVAMILINDDKAATTLADLKSQIDGKKADFAALAKQYSQDDGSKNDGGNIGTLSPAMFPKDYDKVVAAVKDLKEGQVSAPVQTQYGYHLFKLVKVTGTTPPALSSVRDSLIQKATAYKRDLAYQELVKKINDLAVTGASTTDIANQLHLTAQAIKDYPKTDNKTALNQPAVINTAFDNAAAKDNGVSVGIEVGGKTVWVQPSNYRPMKNLSASEAVPQVKAILTENKAKDLALAQAKKIADQVTQSNSTQIAGVEFKNLGKISRQVPFLLPEERSAAFATPTSDGKLAATAQLTSQGASVLVGGAIEKAPDDQLPVDQRQMVAQRMRAIVGQSQFEDYLLYLRSVTDVKTNAQAVGQTTDKAPDNK